MTSANRPPRAVREPAPPRTATLMLVALGLTAVVIVAVAMVVPGLGALIAIGLLPTAAAFVAAAGREQRTLWRCVAPTNIAAAVFAGLSSVEPFPGTTLTLDPARALLVMYGGAAVGWAVFLCVPTTVEGLWRQQTQRRLDKLLAERERLRQDWGPDVDPASEVDADLDGEAMPGPLEAAVDATPPLPAAASASGASPVVSDARA